MPRVCAIVTAGLFLFLFMVAIICAIVTTFAVVTDASLANKAITTWLAAP